MQRNGSAYMFVCKSRKVRRRLACDASSYGGPCAVAVATRLELVRMGGGTTVGVVDRARKADCDSARDSAGQRRCCSTVGTRVRAVTRAGESGAHGRSISTGSVRCVGDAAMCGLCVMSQC
jgi:hypothetical protein